MEQTIACFSFVFICQSGRLEVDALMLALSLQHFVKCDYELVAALPTPASRWGTPRPEILEQFARMNVRMVEVENQIDPDYPIGNKISCLCIPTDKDKQVFVDSDILCLREFSGGEEFSKAFNAKPADVFTFGRDETVWKQAYATMGLEPPSDRVEATITDEAGQKASDFCVWRWKSSPTTTTRAPTTTKAPAKSSSGSSSGGYACYVGMNFEDCQDAMGAFGQTPYFDCQGSRSVWWSSNWWIVGFIGGTPVVSKSRYSCS